MPNPPVASSEDYKAVNDFINNIPRYIAHKASMSEIASSLGMDEAMLNNLRADPNGERICSWLESLSPDSENETSLRAVAAAISKMSEAQLPKEIVRNGAELALGKDLYNQLKANQAGIAFLDKAIKKVIEGKVCNQDTSINFIRDAVKREMAALLTHSKPNEFHAVPQLQTLADSYRLPNFDKLSLDIQSAYLDETPLNAVHGGANLTPRGRFELAIKNMVGGEPQGGPVAADDAVLMTTIENACRGVGGAAAPALDAQIMLTAVRRQLMELVQPADGRPAGPFDDRFRLAQENFQQAVPRQDMKEDVPILCERHILKFFAAVRANGPTISDRTEFARAVLEDASGRKILNLSPDMMNNHLLMNPGLFCESLSPYSEGKVLVPTLDKGAEPKSRLVDISGLGTQRRHRAFDTASAQAYDRFSLSFERPDSDVPRKATDAARRLQTSVHRNGPQLRAVNRAGLGINSVQESLILFTKDALRYVRGEVEIDKNVHPNEPQKTNAIPDFLEGMFVAKYAQAGFSAAQYKSYMNETRVVGPNDRPVIGRPADATLTLSQVLEPAHGQGIVNMSVSELRGRLNYAIPANINQKVSKEAAHLRFVQEAGDHLLARMLEAPDGAIPANPDDRVNQLRSKLDLANSPRAFTYGEMADIARLMFAATPDQHLRIPLHYAAGRYTLAPGDNAEQRTVGGVLAQKAMYFAKKSKEAPDGKVNYSERVMLQSIIEGVARAQD